VLAGGQLWLGNSRGEIVSADVADGKMHIFDHLGGSISLAPVVAGGVLYYLDDGGKITAFR
jgi:outer membrane protein assembly factor BamB